MEIPKRKTPLTDAQAFKFEGKKQEYVEAEFARKLEVVCQELATELELEMNPGHSCEELRRWKDMHDSPSAVYSSNDQAQAQPPTATPERKGDNQ